MRARLTTADKLLLLLIFPVAATAAGMHIREVVRSGLAQLPVYAAPATDGSGYPVVGGYRLETARRGTVLRPGDRLIRLGDRDLRGVGFIGFDAIGLAEAGPRGEVPLIYERDGVRHTTSLPAVPHPHPWTWFPNLLLLPVCALVLLRAPGSREAQRFAAAFTVYALVQAQFYGGPEWQTQVALWLWNLVTPIAVVLMLRFARLFPAEVPEEERVWWGWPWLAGASFLGIRLNFLTGLPLRPQAVEPLSHACHAAYLLGTIAMLGWNYVHAMPIGRRRLKWVLLGAALGSLPLMVIQFSPLAFPDWSGFGRAFALANLATVLWMVGLVVAVVRYNAFDIDRLIGATAAYSSVGIAGLGVLMAGVPVLADRGSQLLGIDEQTARISLAMILAAAVIPLGRRLRPRVDRLLFPERVALESGVESLLEELSHCSDAAGVVACSADRVVELLRPRANALYVREGSQLVRKRCTGLELPEALDPDDPRLPEWRRGRARLEGPDLEGTLVLPFRSAGGLAAVLLLGPKRSGDVYTTSDRSLLAAVSEKASGELLRFQKEAADRQARTNSRLLATASHDIRQPLHALGFMVESLSGKVDSDDGRELVERIQASTRDLSEMLGGLLDLSKLESGAMRVDPQDVSLAPLFEVLEQEFAPSAREKGLRLRVEDSGATVRSDRVLLLRILRNLVGNAIRYTDEGWVEVRARLAADHVRIEVSDSGPGIPEERQREIFQEFRRLGPSARAFDSGLGLGLAIVERLAGLLGHGIEVRSTPGQGSVFSVSLPRAAVRADAGESQDGVRTLTDPLRGRRVVVVDDDASVLEATRGLLVSWGCEVRTASDAAEAEALLEPGWAPEFVLSDYYLGEEHSGVEVIGRLRRAAGAPLPAALVTGDTAPDRIDEMRATGLPVLQKPLAPARLRAVVTQALAGSASRRAG